MKLARPATFPLGMLAAWLLTIWLPTGAAAQSRPQVEQALEREPSITSVQKAALRANGYSGDDLDQWSSRARWAHLLPQVSGEVVWLDQRDLQTRYREDLDTNETGTMYRDSARNDFIDDSRIRTLYGIELKWDLSGLVYDRSESTIAREVRQRREARQRLLEEVTEAYFRRRGHLIELALTPRDQWREHLRLRIDLERETARIDALTGGWFGRALQEAREEES